jgi:hypothetical protein
LRLRHTVPQEGEEERESYWEFFTKTGSIEWTTSWIDCINSASWGSLFETDSSIEAAVFDKAEMGDAQFR